jgi:hypothetical protein
MEPEGGRGGTNITDDPSMIDDAHFYGVSYAVMLTTARWNPAAWIAINSIRPPNPERSKLFDAKRMGKANDISVEQGGSRLASSAFSIFNIQLGMNCD